jgi:hypothetical protein
MTDLTAGEVQALAALTDHNPMTVDELSRSVADGGMNLGSDGVAAVLQRLVSMGLAERTPAASLGSTGHAGRPRLDTRQERLVSRAIRKVRQAAEMIRPRNQADSSAAVHGADGRVPPAADHGPRVTTRISVRADREAVTRPARRCAGIWPPPLVTGASRCMSRGDRRVSGSWTSAWCSENARRHMRRY